LNNPAVPAAVESAVPVIDEECDAHSMHDDNLTTLAPDIVAAILDDTLPNHITLSDLAIDPPALWDEQRARIVGSTPAGGH